MYEPRHSYLYAPVMDNDRPYDGQVEGKHRRTDWDDDLDGSGDDGGCM